jgi:hypothetical protein
MVVATSAALQLPNNKRDLDQTLSSSGGRQSRYVGLAGRITLGHWGCSSSLTGVDVMISDATCGRMQFRIRTMAEFVRRKTKCVGLSTAQRPTHHVGSGHPRWAVCEGRGGGERKLGFTLLEPHPRWRFMMPSEDDCLLTRLELPPCVRFPLFSVKARPTGR